MLARIAKIRAQALLVGVVPLAFFLLLAIVASVLIVEAQGISADAAATTRILIQSDAIATAIRGADNGISVYESGQHRVGLGEYAAAVAAIQLQIQTLVSSVRGATAQYLLAERYAALSGRGLGVLARYFALVRIGRPAEARAYASSPRVQSLSRQLLAAKTAFDRSERTAALARFDGFSQRLRLYAWAILACGLLGVALTFLTVRSLGWRIVRRLELLERNARSLGADRTVTPIKGSDEIAQLDKLYQETMQRLRDALRQKEVLLVAYEREHHVASTLQRALLPHELPTISGVRIDAAYLPAARSAEIGGDWYDVFKLNEHELGLGVGDVAGHDLRAASVMGAVRQAVRIAARENDDPASVLARVNGLLCTNEEQSVVSAFFGVLDLRSGTLRYALGGHPPPIVVHPDHTTEHLDGQGVLLGISRRAEYATFKRHLGIGNAIVLYTDGAVEAERDYEDGLVKLDGAIRAEAFSAAGNIAELIQQRIFRAVDPRDDSAILFVGLTALAHVAPALHTQTWTLNAKDERSAHRVKRALLWHLGEYAVGGSDFGAVETIVGELMSNVVRHTPGHAEMTLEYGEGIAQLHVCDRGKAFTNTGEYPPDVLAENGRGLYMVRSLAHDLRVERTPRGNRVSVLLPVRVNAPAPAPAA